MFRVKINLRRRLPEKHSKNFFIILAVVELEYLKYFPTYFSKNKGNGKVCKVDFEKV